MKTKLSKIVAIVLSVIVIITSLFTAVAFATSSIITKKMTSYEQFGEDYQKGSYTGAIQLDEINFGILDVVNFFTDIKYTILVTRTQDHEQTLRELDKRAEEIQEEYLNFNLNYTGDRDGEYFLDECQEYEEKFEKINDEKKLEKEEFNKWRDENYEAEDFEILSEKLFDDNFLNSLGMIYLFLSSVGETENSEKGRDVHTENVIIDEDKYDLSDLEKAEIVNDKHYYSNSIAITVINVFGGIFIGILVIMSIIFMVVLLVKSIKSIIRLIANAKNSDDPVVIFDNNGLRSIAIAITLLLFSTLVKLIYGAEVQIGVWIYAAMTMIIVNAICSITVKLFVEKFNVTLVINTAIAAVSAVLATLVLLSVINFGIVNTAINKIESFNEKVYYSNYTEKYLDLLKENEDRLNELNIEEKKNAMDELKYDASEYAYAEESEKSGTVRLIIITSVSLLMFIFVIYLFSIVIFRLANGDYYESLVSPVLAIVACIVISIFTVSSVNQLESSIIDGKYSVFIGEYEVEDTVDYKEYQELEDAIVDFEDALKEADEDIPEISDEENKKDALALRDMIERCMNIAKNKQAVLESSSYPSAKIITLLAIILILEIGHKVFDKFFYKKKENTEDALAAETNSEKNSHEKTPALEVSDEEASVDETPAEA